METATSITWNLNGILRIPLFSRIFTYNGNMSFLSSEQPVSLSTVEKFIFFLWNFAVFFSEIQKR